MNSFKRDALYSEFVFTHYEHFPNLQDVDSFLIKRLDENFLCNTILHSIDRNSVDLAAGDSYKEFTLYAWMSSGEDSSYGDIQLLKENDPFLSQVAGMISKHTPNFMGIILIKDEGGYGIPNSNEFGYGEQKTIIFYKKPKGFDIKNLIKKEIERAALEVKREADF